MARRNSCLSLTVETDLSVKTKFSTLLTSLRTSLAVGEREGVENHEVEIDTGAFTDTSPPPTSLPALESYRPLPSLEIDVQQNLTVLLFKIEVMYRMGYFVPFDAVLWHKRQTTPSDEVLVPESTSSSASVSSNRLIKNIVTGTAIPSPTSTQVALLVSFINSCRLRVGSTVGGIGLGIGIGDITGAEVGVIDDESRSLREANINQHAHICIEIGERLTTKSFIRIRVCLVLDNDASSFK